jgi:hypothetical protein
MRYLAALIVLVTSLPLGADPWTDKEKFDAKALVTLTGTITKVEWTNPRVRVTLNVSDSLWVLDGYPPKTLERTGFPQSNLTQGDQITIIAYKAKDGSSTALGNAVTFKDGSTKRFGPTVN